MELSKLSIEGSSINCSSSARLWIFAAFVVATRVLICFEGTLLWRRKRSHSCIDITQETSKSDVASGVNSAYDIEEKRIAYIDRLHRKA